MAQAWLPVPKTVVCMDLTCIRSRGRLQVSWLRERAAADGAAAQAQIRALAAELAKARARCLDALGAKGGGRGACRGMEAWAAPV